MNENPNVLDEEIQNQKDWMDSLGRHSYDHKMIKRKMFWRRVVKIALIIFIIISLLAVLFILIYRNTVKDSTISRVGDYEIGLDKKAKDVYITFDNEKPEEYELLLGSGVSQSHDSNSLSETYLLSPSGITSDDNYMISSFITLVNSPVIKKAGGETAAYDYGVQYFDDEDKAYLGFSKSYYANRFYLINKEEAELNYAITITFAKGSNDCYKAARLILAVKDENGITYYPFGVIRDDGTDERVSQSSLISTRYGNGYYFLLDPNIKDDLKDYSAGSTLFIRSAYLNTVDEQEGIWHCNSLTEIGSTGIFSYSLHDLKIAAGSEVEFTFILLFEASDPDHSTDIKNGSMGFTIGLQIEE